MIAFIKYLLDLALSLIIVCIPIIFILVIIYGMPLLIDLVGLSRIPFGTIFMWFSIVFATISLTWSVSALLYFKDFDAAGSLTLAIGAVALYMAVIFFINNILHLPKIITVAIGAVLFSGTIFIVKALGIDSLRRLSQHFEDRRRRLEFEQFRLDSNSSDSDSI